MSDDPATRMKPQPTPEEDDWETADSAFANSSQTKDGMNKAGALRPSAPSFVPRPQGTTAPAKALYDPKSGSKVSASTELKPSDADEDEWFAVKRPATNRQIWDTANNASAPTIIAPSPSHPNQIVSPAPVMQILRRPTDSTPNSAKKSSAQVKSVEQRAEEYRLARERIFGPSADGTGSGTESPSGGRSGRNSPQPFTGRASGNDEMPSAAGQGGMGMIPTQVRSVSRGEDGRGSGSPASGKGIVRQPRGPTEGGVGFGR